GRELVESKDQRAIVDEMVGDVLGGRDALRVSSSQSQIAVCANDLSMTNSHPMVRIGAYQLGKVFLNPARPGHVLRSWFRKGVLHMEVQFTRFIGSCDS